MKKETAPQYRETVFLFLRQRLIRLLVTVDISSQATIPNFIVA